jgi:hypothetical protein
MADTKELAFLVKDDSVAKAGAENNLHNSRCVSCGVGIRNGSMTENVHIP